MKGVAARGARVLICVVLFFTLIGVAVTTDPQISSLVEKAAQPMSLTNTDWHDGTNQSTSAVDVTYKTEYGTRTAGGSNNTIEGVLNQIMQLSYNDGSGTSVAFGICCDFNPGGVDVANQTVLDWNQLNHIELILSSSSTLNGTPITTMYSFQGFDIISGNASEVSLSQQTNSDGSTFYTLNNVIGCISYWGNAARISAVTLSTENYTYKGRVLQESVATFNVAIAADVINLGLRASSSNEVQVPVPTVLTFQVTHNVTDTEYKYGANIDWSAAKAFPTMPALTTGQNYSLVAQDLLSFSYSTSQGGNMNQIKAFSTDANNDSAIYVLNGKEMCRELLTTQYTMDGSSQVLNTTRIYVADAGHDQGGNVSSIYVVFGGFKYNQSTGLAFDPAVIIPNSVASSSGPFTSSSGPDQILMVMVGLVAIAVVAIAAVVLVHRRRN